MWRSTWKIHAFPYGMMCQFDSCLFISDIYMSVNVLLIVISIGLLCESVNIEGFF